MDLINIHLDNNFGVMHLNIVSLCKNCDEFINFHSSVNCKFKTIGLSEHKISTGHNSINSLYGYNSIYTPCKTSYGSTELFVLSELTYKIGDDLILTFPDEIESTATESENVLCLCVYCHPHMSINKFNEDYLDDFLLLSSKENNHSNIFLKSNIFFNTPEFHKK